MATELKITLRSVEAGELPDRPRPIVTIRTLNSGRRIVRADAWFDQKSKTFYVRASVSIMADFWFYADELQPAADADRIAAFLEI